MNAFVKNNQGSDNALENYFLELLVKKKVIDREIHEVLDIIEKSSFHQEYKNLLKITLFGHENLYFQNWGTLQDGLLDVIKSGEIRTKTDEEQGVIIDIILGLVEEIFDIPDEDVYSFVLLEEREGVEHDIISLMKRMLDHLEVGLSELIADSKNLNKPIEGHIHPEFTILSRTLRKFPSVFYETEKDKIAAIKFRVNELHQGFILEKKSHINSSFFES